MKKIFAQLLAGFLVLTFVIEAVAPGAVLAASYTDSLTSCGGGVYVPTDTTCPSASDPVFFICMVAASAAGIAAASLLAWYPPLALAAFSAAFWAGATLCPRIEPPKPDLDVAGFVIQNNTAPKEGQTIKFQARIKNIGDAGTGTSFLNRFQYHWGASNPWINYGSVSGGPITNGSAVTVYSKDLVLSRTGRLYARVCADKDNIIAESDESNNCSSDSLYFSVAAAPPPLNLSLTLSKDRTTITAGQLVNFTGTIKNNGTVAATNLTQRICIDDSNCISNPITTNILGASASIASIGGGLLSLPFTRAWTATANSSHTAYFCVVGYGCVTNGPFSVAAAPVTVVQCSLDGVSWNAGTSHTFYSTQTAYVGDCDTGTDTNGNSYSRSLQCGSTGTVTNNDSTNSYKYKKCDEITQNAVTITANGQSGATSVRKGSSVQIAWNGSNATSCAVTGLGTTFNGSGVVNSQAVVVNQKTIFTATCTLGSGANSTQKSATVTVNLLPVEVEN